MCLVPHSDRYGDGRIFSSSLGVLAAQFLGDKCEWIAQAHDTLPDAKMTRAIATKLAGYLLATINEPEDNLPAVSLYYQL